MRKQDKLKNIELANKRLLGENETLLGNILGKHRDEELNNLSQEIITIIQPLIEKWGVREVAESLRITADAIIEGDES